MQESPYLSGKSDFLKKLKTIKGLRGFEDSKLMDMLALSKVRSYKQGEIIMEQGSYDYWIYFLLAGSVSVHKDGKMVGALGIYGDVFGEMSIVDGQSRSATIIAEEPTMCLALDGSIVDRIAEEEKPLFFAVLYRFLAEVLADRLRHCTEELARTQAELEEVRGRGLDA